MWAINNKNTYIIKELLDIPMIDVNYVNQFEETPLERAIYSGRVDIVNLILEHPDVNVDVNIICSPSQRNLFYNPALLESIEMKYYFITEQMLNDARTNVNIRNIQGLTALMLAVEQQNIILVKQLLEHPYIKVNLQDVRGMTALMYAVVGKNTEIIKLLLNKPTLNINLQDDDGNTALFYCDNYEIAKLLLQHGIRPDIRNLQELLAWDVVNEDVRKALIEYNLLIRQEILEIFDNLQLKLVDYNLINKIHNYM
jgi:ankyrin repeat protein